MCGSDAAAAARRHQSGRVVIPSLCRRRRRHPPLGRSRERKSRLGVVGSLGEDVEEDVGRLRAGDGVVADVKVGDTSHAARVGVVLLKDVVFVLRLVVDDPFGGGGIEADLGRRRQEDSRVVDVLLLAKVIEEELVDEGVLLRDATRRFGEGDEPVRTHRVSGLSAEREAQPDARERLAQPRLELRHARLAEPLPVVRPLVDALLRRVGV
eukprot:CAMPEP_0197395702 /NCGR_PEP_ID=MMETSP1165-20131217/7220_1 /TAXON_ID=284809 /ORGANISM="Chrysocystis fragilis, Strain CCMP3189" /LENGTH=209 /DNA_ID=CAMNT_0042921471 /DNA_START=129 /DNA_END=758 /DNA_ORIENTATION=-